MALSPVGRASAGVGSASQGSPAALRGPSTHARATRLGPSPNDCSRPAHGAGHHDRFHDGGHAPRSSVQNPISDVFSGLARAAVLPPKMTPGAPSSRRRHDSASTPGRHSPGARRRPLQLGFRAHHGRRLLRLWSPGLRLPFRVHPQGRIRIPRTVKVPKSVQGFGRGLTIPCGRIFGFRRQAQTQALAPPLGRSEHRGRG